MGKSLIKNIQQYRPDIDGLRAVAVLSVLLFHANLPFISGGYIGVDVFFVISGYLITSILIREIESGSYSIIRFYERRFRRLLPALFVVVMATLVVGALILHPRDLLDLGQSAIATAVFSSNILFNLESGYFDGPAEFKPLLHTWSLGVEEQFYIIFPVLLYLLFRFTGRSYKIWIAVIFALSLLLCVVGTAYNATAAFYLLPTRAWELLAGSLLAAGFVALPKQRMLREILAVIGALFIVISLLMLDKTTNFPGYAALLPVIGTCLIIATGDGNNGHTLISRFLAWSPMVFVGLISYSLYLWHWPILVYANYITLDELNGWQVIVALSLSVILAVFSWRFVERPFRDKSRLRSPLSLFSAAFVTSACMLLVGLFYFVSSGMPDRYDYATADYKKNKKIWNHWGVCQAVFSKKIQTESGLCALGKAEDTAKFVLWGDSHARSLAPSVNLSAERAEVSGSIATRGACPPLLAIDRPGRTVCAEFNTKIYDHIVASDELTTVLLAGRWTLAAEGTRYKKEFGHDVQLVDLDPKRKIGRSNVELVEIGLTRTIEGLIAAGKKVVLVNQIPEIGFDVPSVDFLTRISNADINALVAPTVGEYKERNLMINGIIDRLAINYPIELIDTAKFLCGTKTCEVAREGQALYLDDNHLSIFGARYLSSVFDRTLHSLSD